MISKSIEVEKLILDKNNPRFSYYEFNTEEEIIKYLKENENLSELIKSITENGYNSLGERLIVLDNGDDTYRVLEGNRRVASIKLMLNNNIDIAPSNVFCDVVNDIKEAEFKISLKHISGIKKWSPVDKKVFYKSRYEALIDNNFTQKDALKEIVQYTNESYTTIKNDIIKFYFLESVYNSYDNKSSSVLSSLDTDIITGRIFNYLKNRLNLIIDENLQITIDTFNIETFNDILSKIAYYVWDEKIIDTRSINTNSDFDKLLEEKIPELNNLLNSFTTEKNISQINIEDLEENMEYEINEDDISNDSTSIKMIIVNQTLIAKKLPVSLRENIKLFINEIQSTDKIKFTSQDDNIIIVDDLVKSPTKDGIYTILSEYSEIKKEFIVNIMTPITSKYPPSIDIKWAKEQIQLLNNKQSTIKIRSILQYLTNFELESDIDRFISSFLLRALIEYTLELYIKKHGLSITILDNLASAYSQILNSVITKNSSLWTRDEKKVLQSGKNDIEHLNGFIHNSTAYPTDAMIYSTFDNVKSLLEFIYNDL